MRWALPLCAGLAGCATPSGIAGPVAGQYGGAHIGLNIGPSGGTIEYDCATGTIAAILPDAAGRFVSEGTRRPEHGGPSRVGEVLPTLRVRFDGAVRGDQLSLRGRIENGVLLGPFDLRRGAPPQILRCL